MTGGGVGRSRRASQAEQMPWLESMTGRANVGGLARWVRRWVSLVLLPEPSSTKLLSCEAGRGGSYSASNVRMLHFCVHVTMCGGFGAYEKGWEQVGSRLDWAAAAFREGHSTIEMLAMGVSGDLAYAVSIVDRCGWPDEMRSVRWSYASRKSIVAKKGGGRSSTGTAILSRTRRRPKLSSDSRARGGRTRVCSHEALVPVKEVPSTSRITAEEGSAPAYAGRRRARSLWCSDSEICVGHRTDREGEDPTAGMMEPRKER
jgi:hypothetical protein